MKRVCIIGLGFVGEHLVDLLINKFDLYGIDISFTRRVFLQEKYSKIQLYEKLEHMKNNVDIFIICLPTLLDENSEPDLNVFFNIKEQLKPYLSKDKLIIIESSVSVGFTRNLFENFHKEFGVNIAFSPERVDPGNNVSINKIPKIISGINESSLEYINDIYSSVFDIVVKVSSLECAEMCKLYENCFRLINIAYTNEMSDLCELKGINPLEMINACATKPYGFMKFTPGLGVGGHCIPINPYYILDKNTPILKMAVNQTEFRVVKKANEIKEKGYQKVLIIGTAYKPGQTSTENSPGLKLFKELQKNNIYTKLYDPLVIQTDDYLEFNNFTKEYISKNFDHIVVATKQHNVNYDILS
jgi:nucleotide sugar dehydrogenase